MRYIAFDFDGTIADTHFAICEAMERACIRNGLTYIGDDEFSQHIGQRLEDITFYAIEEQVEEDTIRNVIDSYRQTFRYSLVKIFDGMKEVIENCYDNGDKLAIASSRNQNSLADLVKQLEIEKYFTVILSGNEVQEPKPHQESMWKIATELGCNPIEIMMIGDHMYDIEMAKDTGAIGLGVTWGSHDEIQLRSSGADMVFDEVKQLEKYLQNNDF